MTIYTSYFYQVRFFPPNLIPISTAVWDPKWFHDNHNTKDQSYQFHDKRGVLNGLRAPMFAPGENLAGYCGPACGMEPNSCDFLLGYRAQLNKLDFHSIMGRFNALHDQICLREGFSDCDFALLVHEAPTKLCSERVPLQQWFADHGIPVQEWSK